MTTPLPAPTPRDVAWLAAVRALKKHPSPAHLSSFLRDGYGLRDVRADTVGTIVAGVLTYPGATDVPVAEQWAWLQRAGVAFERLTDTALLSVASHWFDEGHTPPSLAQAQVLADLMAARTRWTPNTPSPGGISATLEGVITEGLARVDDPATLAVLMGLLERWGDSPSGLRRLRHSLDALGDPYGLSDRWAEHIVAGFGRATQEPTIAPEGSLRTVLTWLTRLGARLDETDSEGQDLAWRYLAGALDPTDGPSHLAELLDLMPTYQTATSRAALLNTVLRTPAARTPGALEHLLRAGMALQVEHLPLLPEGLGPLAQAQAKALFAQAAGLDRPATAPTARARM